MSKYQLYLPEREELRREIERTLRIVEESAREEFAEDLGDAKAGDT